MVLAAAFDEALGMSVARTAVAAMGVALATEILVLATWERFAARRRQPGSRPRPPSGGAAALSAPAVTTSAAVAGSRGATGVAENSVRPARDARSTAHARGGLCRGSDVGSGRH